MRFLELKSKHSDLKSEIRLKLLMQHHCKIVEEIAAAKNEREILALLKQIDQLNSQKVKIVKGVKC